MKPRSKRTKLVLIIPNDKILPVDIDGTLIEYVGKNDCDFVLEYGGLTVPLRKKRMNIALMKHHKTTRGYTILVWSANGKEWAETVIRKLKLQEYVDIIMTKPCKLLDDKPASEWMWDQINLEDK